MQNDAVIARHEAAVEKFRGRLSGAEMRADRAMARVVRPDGNTRHGAANEMAARRVEIDALKDAVRAAEAELTHAREDAPRRAQERSRAEKLEAEARDMAEKVDAARRALEAAAAAHAAKVADAEAVRYRASRTRRELDRIAEREAA